MATWIIRADRLPEFTVPGKRLGRHVRHDSRSLLYQAAESAGAASVIWPRHIPILDQGDIGSCTGNAMTGALATNPLWADRWPGLVLDETEALRIYSQAEVIDGDGPYPPQDNGSSGLSVAQAAKADGLISGYLHATSVAAMQTALRAGPVIIGINWYDSFDSPAASGLVTIGRAAEVRGGHEVVVRGIDTEAQQFHADNSWGVGWGVAGSFLIGFDTMTRLLAEDGDCTVPLPRGTEPPTPTPAPVVAHPDRDYGHDPKMLAWAAGSHVGANAYAAGAYMAWRAERGYR